jgi:thiol-disulfide isomerase/thioredoxin
MKKFILLLFFALSASNAATAAMKAIDNTATKVKFITASSFAEIRQKAKDEGKLIFIDFYASWCSPCQFMDESTFNDDNLALYMNRNWVSYKVDVEDFEGYNLKQQFGVKMLPTLLVLNAQGTVLARLEETVTPTKMLDFLKKYDTPKNKGTNVNKPTPPSDAVAQTSTNESASKTTMTEVKNTGTTAPKMIAIPSVPKAADRIVNNAPAPPKVTAPAPPKATAPIATVPTTTAPKRVSVSMPTVAGNGLYEFSVKKHESRGFSVQTNSFQQLAFVLREVDKLKQNFPDQPVLVYVFTPEGKTEPNYRILVGAFTSEAQAEPTKAKLKNFGVPNPMTKNLATMK